MRHRRQTTKLSNFERKTNRLEFSFSQVLECPFNFDLGPKDWHLIAPPVRAGEYVWNYFERRRCATNLCGPFGPRND